MKIPDVDGSVKCEGVQSTDFFLLISAQCVKSWPMNYSI